MGNHKWTDEEREIVRRDYKGTHASNREIARMLGVTEYQVRGQASRMGLGKRTDRRPWDPDQDERLRALIPCYSVNYIANLMHRSVNSVVVRSKRLGLHRRNHDGWYTKLEVCEILGVDHHWVQRRIDSGALKATYHNGRRPSQRGMAMWHISEHALRSFIRRYPEELNGRNVDLIQIVEILGGIRYETSSS
jgi:hypothetical protein